MPETITPHVSVIVASHREQFIEGLLASFDGITGSPVPTEVIIVADYPVEPYKEIYSQIELHWSCFAFWVETGVPLYQDTIKASS